MKYAIFLFLLCSAFVLGAGFNVGVVVQAVTADFTNFEQTSPAYNDENPVTLNVPVSCSGNSSETVNLSLPTGFINATNHTVIENGSAVESVRVGNAITWNATCNVTSYIEFTVPAPQVTSGSATVDSLYRLPLLISTVSAMKNATISITVPQYSDYRLTELVGAVEVDRTQTYNLTVEDTNAAFTVPFSALPISRNLTLTAVLPSGSSGGSRQSLEYRFPTRLYADVGSTSTAQGTIRNTGSRAQTVTLSSVEPALSVSPNIVTISGKATVNISLEYSPRTAMNGAAVVLAKSSHTQEIAIQLSARAPLYPISLNVTNGSRVDANVSVDVPASIVVVVRDSALRELQRVTVVSQEQVSTVVDVQRLPPGDYEVCVIVVDQYESRSEKCEPLHVSAPRVEDSSPLPEPQGIPVLVYVLILCVLVAGALYFWWLRH